MPWVAQQTLPVRPCPTRTTPHRPGRIVRARVQCSWTPGDATDGTVVRWAGRRVRDSDGSLALAIVRREQARACCRRMSGEHAAAPIPGEGGTRARCPGRHYRCVSPGRLINSRQGLCTPGLETEETV